MRPPILVLAVAAVSAVSPMAHAGIPLGTYQMSSSSMRPTLDDGDIVGADTLKGLCGLTHPRPGDVVIHRRRGRAGPYVARVVAGPGQRVEMLGGRLVIDGHSVRAVEVGKAAGDFGRQAQIIRETLPNGVSYLTLDLGPHETLDELGSMRVPQDNWFLLGDNRDNAADSRVASEQGGAGFVPTKDICGIVNIVLRAKDKTHVGRKP